MSQQQQKQIKGRYILDNVLTGTSGNLVFQKNGRIRIKRTSVKRSTPKKT